MFLLQGCPSITHWLAVHSPEVPLQYSFSSHSSSELVLHNVLLFAN